MVHFLRLPTGSEVPPFELRGRKRRVVVSYDARARESPEKAEAKLGGAAA